MRPIKKAGHPQRKSVASDFKRLPGHGKPLGLGLADVTRRKFELLDHIGQNFARVGLTAELAQRQAVADAGFRAGIVAPILS